MTYEDKLLVELLQEPLVLYRIVDGKVADQSDRLKSIRALPTESFEFLADIVYARRRLAGILTFRTPVRETGGIGPTNIIDIAVISQKLNIKRLPWRHSGKSFPSPNWQRKRG